MDSHRNRFWIRIWPVLEARAEGIGGIVAAFTILALLILGQLLAPW